MEFEFEEFSGTLEFGSTEASFHLTLEVINKKLFIKQHLCTCTDARCEKSQEENTLSLPLKNPNLIITLFSP